MYAQRSLRASLGGALLAGAALFGLGLQGSTPEPLAALFDTTPTRTVADEQAAAAKKEAAAQAAAAAPAPAPAPAPDASAAAPQQAAVVPVANIGPKAPPLPTMPSGPVIRVSKSGGDYSTISAAAAKAKPGDTVLISGGTYAETLAVPNDGAAGKPITFQAVPGQKVVIDGGGSRESGNGLVSLNDRSNITMIGITVQGSGSHGIFAQGAKNIVLRDCTVADSQDGGIVFLESSGVDVQRCDINGNNARGTSASNEAMSFDHTSDFEISFSKVHNNGEEGIDAKYDSTGGKIFNNTVDGNRGPNIYIDSANGVEVFNNVVTGTTEDSKAGISVAVENLSDTKKAANVKIYNNIVRGNAGGGIGFWTESSGTFSGIQILNNTVVDNSKSALNIIDGNFSGTNLLRNNIFSGNGSDSISGGDFLADHNLVGSKGLNLLADLRLTKGSAGIAAGSSDAAPAFDITGAPRPAGSIDIGAYQLVDTAAAAAALSGLAGQLQDVSGQLTASLATAILGSAQRAASADPAAATSTPAPAGT